MVSPGIDNLIAQEFRPLQGARIGLVTNHTGVTSSGLSTIDALHMAPGVELKALFSPEHGIRGERDEKLGDSRDTKTGLPVYSLYGETLKPKPEQLTEIDTLVYDIQDVGARVYTFEWTMALSAAATPLPIIPLAPTSRILMCTSSLSGVLSA